MQTDHIIEVNESDFQFEVLHFSLKTPVVVDFRADWCVPCRTLGPILENLAHKSHGQFRLAKVDVDTNPGLAMRYEVRSIPAVKGFRGGQVVAGFTGLLPEPEVAKFLRGLAPGPDDLLIAKGKSVLADQRWQEAAAIFNKALANNPTDAAARLGLIKTLIGQNKPEEASKHLGGFPASKEYTAALTLAALTDALLEPLTPSDTPLEAAYQRAISLVRRGNFAAALDGLLEILRQDKRYRGDGGRKLILAVFELLGEDAELTRQYRTELAAILF